MVPYFLLLLIPVFFCFVSVKRSNSSCYATFGLSEKVRSSNVGIPVFFIILFFMLAFRSTSVGNDTANYEYYFLKFRSMSLSSILSQKNEMLFALLNWIVGLFTDNFRVFLIVTSAIIVFPIARAYNADREHSILKIALFLNLSTFIMLFSGIRQSIAFALGLIAFDCVKNGKKLCFVLWTLLAFGFHESAFILFALYPLYHANFRKEHFFLMIPVIFLVFIFRSRIFGVLMVILRFFSSKYANISSASANAYSMLILFLMLSAFCYLVPDETMMDREAIGLRNILLFSTLLQAFASVHVLAMRMNYYFIILIPLAISKALDAAGIKNRKIAKIGETVICLFFMAYYIITIIASRNTGGALHTVPYTPFWEG